jgi:hypothetical protein
MSERDLQRFDVLTQVPAGRVGEQIMCVECPDWPFLGNLPA